MKNDNVYCIQFVSATPYGPSLRDFLSSESHNVENGIMSSQPRSTLQFLHIFANLILIISKSEKKNIFFLFASL